MTDYVPEQKAALKALIEQLKEEYPQAEVHGYTESRFLIVLNSIQLEMQQEATNFVLSVKAWIQKQTQQVINR